MAPKKRVRAAVKLPTDALEDPEVRAAAENKDAKRSDGSSASKFAAAAAAPVVNRFLQKPPEQYPVLPKAWDPNDLVLTPRDRLIAAKAQFLSRKYYYSGFYLRPPLLGGKPTTVLATAPGAPGTVAPIAVTASVGLPSAAAIATLHEVARYSDRYRLMEGKRDLADEIHNPSDVIFPKDLLRRLKKKPRLAAPTAATAAGAAPTKRPAAAAAAAAAGAGAGVSADAAEAADAAATFDALARESILDDEDAKNAFDAFVTDDAADATAGAGTGAGAKKKGDDDDDGTGKPANGADGEDGVPAEADADDDDEADDYGVNYEDDDEDGNDAFDEDRDEGVM